MARTVAPLGASLMGMALALTAAAPAMAREPLALGISTPPGDDVRVLDRFSARVGRRPALWSIWVQWGRRGGSAECSRRRTANCAFPTEMARQLVARRVTPVVWWEPVDPSLPYGGRYSDHRSILSGAHDGYIRAWAREARDFGRRHDARILLRFAHEHNGSFFPWGVGHYGNTSASFKKMWRHVWRIFRDVGALRHVDFLWTVTKQRCPGCNPFKPFYPGDRFVDYVGFSAFNWGTSKRWKSMPRILRQPIRQLRRITHKPIIVAELASSHRGGDRPAWIRKGYRAVYRRWPRVKAILYLDTSSAQGEFGHPDWALDRGSDESALDAYGAIARDGRFQGSLE